MTDKEKFWVISGPKPCPINRWADWEKDAYYKQERHKRRCKKRALLRQQALEEAAANAGQVEAKDEPLVLEPWKLEPKLEPWELEPKLEPWNNEPKVEGILNIVELMLSVEHEQVQVAICADPIVRAASEEVEQVV
jgi:hypothetical protein